MPNKYVGFVKVGNKYEVWNIIYDQKVGVIKKARMGTWMHWQLFWDVSELQIEMNKLYECSKSFDRLQWQTAVDSLLKRSVAGFSNGCLREISAFITTLYSKNKE